MSKIKITRTLFVGLGGTGVKAILRAKQCFVDAYGEVPPMVAFLAIDTDRAIRDKFLTARNGKTVRFSENEICFCGITGSAFDIYHNSPSLFQWLPTRNSSFLQNLQNTGAGQIRSNGRFLARHNAVQIGKRISNKVAQIGQPVPLDCKFVYDTNKDGVVYPTKVNVVGSVAGGTGSGMIIDMLVLIAKTLRESGLPYSISPWVVLPEVFRYMAPGPASTNVYQNAYGAVRELDYLYHLPNENQNALDFGFEKVYYLDEGIEDTYLINNTNKAGVVFQNIDEITDSIGRCMFLPSNEVDSVKDNTNNVRFVYDIKNKKSNYVSAGSAEIVYDNQAVGNVIARTIISDICDEMIKADTMNALTNANAWMSSESVAIQEHNADLLTDSILPKYAPFSILVDKNTDINTINAYVSSGSSAQYVFDEVKNKVVLKVEAVKAALDQKINEILNTQNGVGEVVAFLLALIENIDVCKKEMNAEVDVLQNQLVYPVDWNNEISLLRKGVLKIFDKDAAELLQSKVADYIAQQRDLLRHKWAIQFYSDFETYVNEHLDKMQVFKTKIENVTKKQTQEITAIQGIARSTSQFQIYLHFDDVTNYERPNVEQISALFRSQVSVNGLVDKTVDQISNEFFNFAKVQQPVVDAVNISIDQKLSSMSDSQLRGIFARIKEMSSPLWATNTLGYLDHAQEMTTIFTIGVYDQSKGIIQEKYLDEFTLGEIKPTFAATHETDRITFFQSQCYSPAFAVNNLPGYMREAEEKLRNSDTYPVYYLDEKWHQRMLVEGFDIMPKQEKDRVLPNWVNAIVYGYVKYDESKRTYYMESDQGDILSGGFLELGQRRDLAFDQFQLKGLDKEIEEHLQQKILEQGRPTVTSVLKAAKDDVRNYVTTRAQLSAIELDRVGAKDPAYQMVRDMLEKEVRYLKELEF